MAHALIPAPEERMAVLEMRELPGRASTMDWARLEGSISVLVEEEEEAERIW